MSIYATLSESLLFAYVISIIKVYALAQADLIYSKTCVKLPLAKRPQIGFQGQLSLNAGQKYCRMFQGEHSATFSTFINKLPFVIKIFVLSIFEWLLYKGFTVTIVELFILEK